MQEVVFCRLCALKKDTFVNIYDEEGHKLNIQTKINKCLHIEVSFEGFVCQFFIILNYFSIMTVLVVYLGSIYVLN